MKLDMFGKVDGVERALEYHLQRHNVLAGNLSNIETPGYRMRDLRFEESLESEMDGLNRTDRQHLVGSGSEIDFALETEALPSNINDNNVMLEKMMARISGNKIRYEAGIAIARKQLGILKYVATNGGA